MTLPTIPVLDTGPDFPIETLIAEEARAHALLDGTTRRVPVRLLQALDTVSRRWLEKWSNPHLPEIDAVSRRLKRAGAYFLAVNYEWGCTCRVAPSPDHATARLVRVLDWKTPGLGRYVIAARVHCKAGRFVTLTWPGYTGVLQGMAPSRFAAALNQAPMRKPTGLYYLDWAANRRRVWNMPHQMPAHLLRDVFEQANSFEEAREMLITRPVSTPTIFSLAGVTAKETCVIERSEEDARVHDGINVAANHWQAPGWVGHPRGQNSTLRSRQLHQASTEFDSAISWLAAPVLNPNTRLAMIADACLGRLVARGYEAEAAATETLELSA